MSDRARILLFTGDGKGKTTAALGMVLRALGHGMPSLVLQFIKGDAATGEVAAAQSLPGVQLVQVGLGFVPPRDHGKFPEHVAAARDGLRRAAQAIASGAYPLVVLDEVCTAVSLGLLEEAAVIEVVRKTWPGLCVVLTGRGATAGLIDLADTATDMRCLKHAHQSGTPAQRGVEF